MPVHPRPFVGVGSHIGGGHIQPRIGVAVSEVSYAQQAAIGAALRHLVLVTGPVGWDYTDRQLDDLVQEAQKIEAGVSESERASRNNASRASDIENRLVRSSTTDLAKSAVQAVVELANKTEQLSHDPSKKAGLLGACKAQAKVVHTRFDKLHDEVAGLLGQANALDSEVVHEGSLAETRDHRVHQIRQTLQTMKEQDQKQQRLASERRDTSRKHVEEAKRARDEAVHKRNEAQSARNVRNIFLPWVGEALDIGGLNHAVDVANSTIRQADSNLRENEELVRTAQDRLSKLERQVGGIDRLCSKVSNFDPTMHRQLQDVNALHKRLGNLAPKILAAAQFAGALAAKSSTLPYNFSAASFASKMLDLETEMKLNTGMRNTLLGKEPQKLEATLKAIAQSDADLGDIM